MNIACKSTSTNAELAAELASCLATTKPEVLELDQVAIPTCSSIVRLIDSLKEILFPGFCDGHASTHQAPLLEYLEEKLDHFVDLLTAQIAIAIALDGRYCDRVPRDSANGTGNGRPSSKPRDLAIEFTRRLPKIREHLSTDVQAAYDGDPACRNLCEVVLCYPGLRAIVVHRVAHELYSLGVPFLPRMMAEWVHGETGIDIHPGATIGRHFFIDHGTGVVIGQTCVIGEHVKIYQGVTLGALSFPTDNHGALVRDTRRHPTIQDNVVIYANATVLGGNTVIGHDSVIGSSVWITRSVDPFTTIIMEKPKLHVRDQTPVEFQPPLNYQI